jgi:hypothetical protein
MFQDLRISPGSSGFMPSRVAAPAEPPITQRISFRPRMMAARTAASILVLWGLRKEAPR